MVQQSLLSHLKREKADADDTQQSSLLVTPIKSEQIFDMYFDTIFYWYWRGVHNIKYSSAFQEIRGRAVLSQKLSRDPWGVPIRSNTTEPRSTIVHYSFYKRLWCMGSQCYICLQFLSHAHTHYSSDQSTNDQLYIPLRNIYKFPSSMMFYCVTWCHSC